MIDSAFKKLAKEKGLNTDSAFAYGFLDGYSVVFFDAPGRKIVLFNSRVEDAIKKDEFLRFLDAECLTKKYQIASWLVSMKTIRFEFNNSSGVMNRIRDFLTWIIPVLQEYGATGWNICSECGQPIDQGKWISVNGFADYVHEACAEKIREQVQTENDKAREERDGSYATGAMGAFLGAILGAALWAAVLMAGYIASIVGLAIGFFAKFGYNLCHGRKGKGMIVILILAVVFGVLLGTISAEALAVAEMISNGELYGCTYADIPWLISAVLQADAEYRSALLGQILTGLLFAGLGVFALLRNAGREIADVKFKELS